MAEDANDESVLFLPAAATGEGDMFWAGTWGEGATGGPGVAFLGAFDSVLTSMSQHTQYISPALCIDCPGGHRYQSVVREEMTRDVENLEWIGQFLGGFWQ